VPFSSPLPLLERMLPVYYSQVQGELKNTAIQPAQPYFSILGEDRNKSRNRKQRLICTSRIDISYVIITNTLVFYFNNSKVSVKPVVESGCGHVTDKSHNTF